MRKVPEDLRRHCVNIRFLLDGVYVWEFERRGGLVNMRVEGWAIFNRSPYIVCAPLDGQSVAFLPEFAPYMRKGVWYSRRQHSPAFSLVVEALRM